MDQFYLAGDAGLEPTHVAVKVLCLTNLANPLNVVSAQGFEPRTHALEGRCSIQLSYAPTLLFNGAGEGDRTLTAGLEGRNSTIELHPHIDLVEDGGFEPPKAMLTDLQSAPFGRSGNPPYYIWSW